MTEPPHTGRERHIQASQKKKVLSTGKRSLRCFTAVLALCMICLACVSLLPGAAGSKSQQPTDASVSMPQASALAAEPTPAPTPQVQTVTFSATGDDLIHQGIYQQAAAQAGAGEKYNFSSCYANMADFYAGYDVNWINQESLVSDELEPSTYPTFCTPGECAKALYDIGFRVFSLSNNHVYDKGSTGIASTRRFWASMPQDTLATGLWAGEADYDTIPIQEMHGIKIAYLSYTDMTNGIPTPSDAEANVIYTSQTDVIQRQVELARQQADFVAVGVHWGVEDSHTTTEAQKQLAQNLADWGADVIIGTHPHVVQNGAWLTAADGRQAFVAYSLGNFISTQKHTDNLVGAVLTFTIQKTTQPDGSVSVELQQPKLHPTVTHFTPGTQNIQTYLYRDYTPELAAGHGVRSKDSSFTYEHITEILEQNISPEFLETT